VANAVLKFKPTGHMRHALMTLMIIIPTISFGQLLDELPKDENGNLNYNEVIQVDSIKKDELYLRSKQFFVDVFKSAKDVIQMDDKEAGVVVGKGFNDIYIKVMGIATSIQMWYTIKIQSKEGRYKYEIYDIYFKSYPGQYGTTTTRAEEMFDKRTYFRKNGDPRDVQEKYKIETTLKANSLVTAIKTTMNKPVTSSDKKDW
jgi:hypothetical protein